MGLGPPGVCSRAVFMEGNVSSGGPSFLHRRADHKLPGKGLVADSLGTAAGAGGHQMTLKRKHIPSGI